MILAADPGARVGLVVFRDGRPEEPESFPIGSRLGARRLRDYIERASRSGVDHLVVEYQYPRPGRSFKSQVGLAQNRGALLHEARISAMRITAVAPQEWKRPVCRRLRVPWSASPGAKAEAFAEYALELLGRSPSSPDLVDAVLLGHWFLNAGLYL